MKETAWNPPVSFCYEQLREDFYQKKRLHSTLSIVRTPTREIACRSMSDDFYSNLIDWSGEFIYYTVEDTIYAYNFYTEKVILVYEAKGCSLTSVKHNAACNTLCVGTSLGLLLLIDTNTAKASKYMYHRSRIGALAVFQNHIVTGSRDKKAKIIDLRLKMPVETLTSHCQEICGLAVSADNRYIATGGNDNKVFAFDTHSSFLPMCHMTEHKAAVKALAWSPLKTTQLVSGGGTADKTIKLWDISSPNPLVRSYDYDSQVCNLYWLQNNKILGTFGYSNDDIKLLNNFRIEKKFVGHKNRVIHFSIGNDENLFVSGSSDSSIKIWTIERAISDIEIR